jgi:hypothetical protein
MIILLSTHMDQLEKATKLRKESTELLIDSWLDLPVYRYFEFWMIVLIFLVPLLVVVLKIDKSKIFLIGFYGYCVHMSSFYISLLGVNFGLWNYPFQLIPSMPSLAYDASFVPVTYMLAYQWTLNQKKNYYLTLMIIAGILAFIIEPLLVIMNLYKTYGHVTHIHSFIIYVGVALIAKFITNVFLWLQKRSTKAT